MEHTHYLDVRIGIDSIPIFSPENMEGVKLALGVKQDNQILEVFATNFVKELESVVKKFINTSIESANISVVENFTAAKIDEEHEINQDDTWLEDIQSEVNDYLFNIYAERGTVEDIIIKDSRLFEINIDTEFGLEDIPLILREDLDVNFMIRYKDTNGKICEMKEIG